LPPLGQAREILAHILRTLQINDWLLFGGAAAAPVAMQ
jgi:hypothetical protein